jgi:hypothetical protein
MRKILLILISTLTTINVFGAVNDTLILKKEKGVNVLFHQVEPRQNIYRIAKHYNVAQIELKNINKLEADSLSKGQMLKIPITKKNWINKLDQLSDYKNGQLDGYKPEELIKDTLQQIYYVTKGTWNIIDLAEYLPMPESSLRKWNHLSQKTLTIEANSTLKVGYIVINKQPITPALTPKLPAKVEVPTPNPSSIIVKTDTVQLRKDTSKVVAQESQNIKIQKLYASMYQPKNVIAEDELTQHGPALGMSTDSARINTLKSYYALSNTIQVGRIVKVTNPMNQKMLFVKILGKIPDLAENQHCIIKISPEAAEELGAIDERFLVDLYYYPKK